MKEIRSNKVVIKRIGLQGIAIALLFILINPIPSHSQEVVTAETFFSTITNQSTSTLPSNSNPVNFPIIEEYDLRTRTNDLDLKQQEFIFRVSPSTKKKRAAQQSLYVHFNAKPDFKSKELLCEQRLIANLDWLNFYILHRNLDLIQQMNLIYADKNKVLQKQLASLNVDYKEVIDQQIDNTDLAFDEFKNIDEMAFLFNKYGYVDQEFSFEGFLSMSALASILELERTAQPFVNPEVEYDLQLIDKELALENAESKHFFDFAELRYEGPQSDLLEERITIGAALTFPNSGNRKLKVEELKLQKQRLEYEIQNDNLVLENEIRRKRADLQKLLNQFLHFEDLAEKENDFLSKLGESLLQNAEVDPYSLLKINERKVQNQIKELELVEDIYESYLELIYISGEICNADRVNFLQ